MTYRMEPYAEYEQRELEREERGNRLPHCWNCGEPIWYSGIHIVGRNRTEWLDMWLCTACAQDMEEETNED